MTDNKKLIEEVRPRALDHASNRSPKELEACQLNWSGKRWTTWTR